VDWGGRLISTKFFWAKFFSSMKNMKLSKIVICGLEPWRTMVGTSLGSLLTKTDAVTTRL
jgi:hypothetical protein